MKSALGLGIAGFALAACTGTSTVATVPLPATAIVVDPADFMDDVPCLDTPGAMRRYVATLFSVDPAGPLDAGRIELPSSPPTSCNDPVWFQRVVDGTQYIAEIDGYDHDDIRPLGSDGGPGTAGSRTMVGPNNQYVAPRWTTSCGKPRLEETGHDASTDTGVVPYGRCVGNALRDGQAPDPSRPVCAVANTVIAMRGCAPLHEVSPPPTRAATVTVDLADTLGNGVDGGSCLRCGSGPGMISRFRVELRGAHPETRWADCGKSVSFETKTDTVLDFTVTAYGSGFGPDGGACSSDGGTQTDSGAVEGTDAALGCLGLAERDRGACGVWYTECVGRPILGITRRAECYSLGTAAPYGR